MTSCWTLEEPPQCSQPEEFSKFRLYIFYFRSWGKTVPYQVILPRLVASKHISGIFLKLFYRNETSYFSNCIYHIANILNHIKSHPTQHKCWIQMKNYIYVNGEVLLVTDVLLPRTIHFLFSCLIDTLMTLHRDATRQTGMDWVRRGLKSGKIRRISRLNEV